MRPVVSVAAAQVVLGLVGFVVLLSSSDLTPPTPLANWARCLQILSFGAASTYLLLGARSDRRPMYLGTVLGLVAASYAQMVVRELARAGPAALHIASEVLRITRTDALLPLFLWLFVREFPRALASRRTALLGRIGVVTSACVGTALLCVLPLRQLDLVASHWLPVIDALSAESLTSLYWTLVYGLTLAALAVMILRTRNARREERRRVRLFVAALLVGGLPSVLIILLGTISPGISALFVGPTANIWAMTAAQLSIASIPIVTAYAVVVERVLDVRLILRQALHYAFARSTILAAAAIPFVWLLAYLYDARNQRLGDLTSGRPALMLLSIAAASLITLRLRRTAMRGLDRLFFREQYEANRILADLAERGRSATSVREIALLFATEIDRALHLDAVELLPIDRTRHQLRSPRRAVPALDTSTELARRLRESRVPLDVDLERPGAMVTTLPAPERQWLAEGGFRMLVPLLGSTGELLGCIGLGMKRSEVEFSPEDTALLTAVASAGGLALENRLLRDSAGDGRGTWEGVPAKECATCKQIVPEDLERCPHCGSLLTSSLLPQILFGKFRIEGRLGAGALGVVFRATDLDLERTVAIKTLPAVSPEDAMRLRREARAMAAISHPNLATIYGAETWRDIPMLILEYLSGGTLEARMRDQRLPEPDAVSLGLAFADVLEQLHSVGVLHRDIKPSNVAYTDTGVPKLLDFDLARVVNRAPPAHQPPAERMDGRVTGSLQASGLTGTPLYMSPEALRGGDAEVSFDLWGAAVTLYEAVAGRHPFERSTWTETLATISEGACPDIRDFEPSCSEAVASFFCDALSHDRRRRPESARQLRQRLEACAEMLPQRARA